MNTSSSSRARGRRNERIASRRSQCTSDHPPCTGQSELDGSSRERGGLGHGPGPTDPAVLTLDAVARLLDLSKRAVVLFAEVRNTQRRQLGCWMEIREARRRCLYSPAAD